MKFFNEHPFVALLMVSIICTAAVDIAKIAKGDNLVIALPLVGNKKKEKSDKSESRSKDLPKEENSKESE